MKLTKTAVLFLGIASVSLTAPASAQSWLNKGLDTLETLSGSDNSGESSGTSSSAGSVLGAALSDGQIVDGLKQALEVGTDTVVSQIGVVGGYFNDDNIRIPLPGYLQSAQKVMRVTGFGQYADELELKINEAAERAAPEARDLFVDAISGMSLEDARNILNGPDDAATAYFQRVMTPALTERFTPIVEQSMAEVGVVQAYDEMTAAYQAVPQVPDVKSELSSYTVSKALEGLFYYVAEEEAKIRANPAARTTDLLKTVFGS
ncbi:DUF4197 domain-containing protein [Kiloniella sp. b19]|uniref:DUF4197 domain-containing protein n=1 Tax=Kiloniella sp. GXU_MW_B19 TaxID=3141326 RepID=UPI0031E13256